MAIILTQNDPFVVTVQPHPQPNSNLIQVGIDKEISVTTTSTTTTQTFKATYDSAFQYAILFGPKKKKNIKDSAYNQNYSATD